MPAKHIFSAEEIDTLDRELKTLGYEPMTLDDVKKEEERLDWKEPRDQEGTKIPYTSTHNYYEARMYPSILFETEVPAESSAAWGMIRENDRAVYFTTRLHRTDNFIYNFLGWAEILIVSIKNRPLCPDPLCKDLMNIVEKKNVHREYFYLCENKGNHDEAHESCIMEFMPKKIFEKLSPRAQDVWNTYTSKQKWYKKKLDKEGKKPGKSREERIPWEIKKPQNIH